MGRTGESLGYPYDLAINLEDTLDVAQFLRLLGRRDIRRLRSIPIT